jgi:hypothetical protein
MRQAAQSVCRSFVLNVGVLVVRVVASLGACNGRGVKSAARAVDTKLLGCNASNPLLARSCQLPAFHRSSFFSPLPMIHTNYAKTFF